VDSVLLSRLQFALTAGFHFLFPPLTIGLSWFLVGWIGRWWRTGREEYRRTARFWLHIFAVSFAVGVASGIPLEFQFGTNWAGYARFVGDVFGAPLAAEGILAFFLESVFIGVLLFGWTRLSSRTLWVASWMVAVGSTLSGFWIIVANSWQQTPAGFRIVNGRAELTDLGAALWNPSTLPRYLHTIGGALLTGALFVLGVSALYLLRHRHRALARAWIRPALGTALAAAVLQLGLGHYHAMQVAETQPEKLAAVEGLFESGPRAPALLFGVPDAEAGRMRAAVKVPGLLSLLAFGDVDAYVQGLDAFPRDEWPPLALTFYPFHLMVGLGMFFLALPALGLILWWRGRLETRRAYLRAAVWAIPLPFVANELGWITAEVGRQPWIVYRVLRTQDAVSASLPASHVAVSFFGFGVLYAVLFAVWIRLLKRAVDKGPAPAEGGPA